MSETTPHLQLRKLTERALVRHGMPVVQRLFRPGWVVADIGANIGGCLVNWFEYGAGHVHAFEPVPAVFEQLHANWGHDPRATLYQAAIGDRTAVVGGCQVLNAHTLAPLGTGGLDLALEDQGQFDMHVRRLDDYSVHWDRLDFIKLDVDGYEPAALRGARGTLTRFRPPIMLELSYLPRKLGESCEEMVESLYRAAYRICTMSGEVCPDSTWVMEAFPWRTSFDVLAMPAEQVGGWAVVR